MFSNKMLWIFIPVQLCIINVVSSDCNCTPVITELDKFHGHILRRRTRAIVFPNKANLLLTPAFTKAVLDGRPRGLSYSMEFDMYSPLPDTIEGWKPTILINTKENNIMKNYTKSYSKNSLASGNILEGNQPLTDEYEYYTFLLHGSEESNVENEYFKLKWPNKPIDFVRRESKLDLNKRPLKVGNFASYFHRKPYLDKNNYNKKWTTSHRSFNVNNENYTERSKLNRQSERERRQIVEQLEILGTIFKFNMKKCIQRAKCELISQFRSYGESLMEDIVKIILIPSYISNLSGERDNKININCEQRFATTCPYRILDFLTKNVRAHISSSES